MPHSISTRFDSKDVTGVYSRAALNLMLQKAIEESHAENSTFSLLLLDLDHFKSVNDAFGHLRGDHVLTELAHRLLRFSRETDLVFRYGGDEFVILFKNTDKPQAVLIANRLLNRIAETPFNVTPPLSLTISVGLVNYPAEGLTAEELFEIADRRHYIAKRSGRGRVISEDPASPHLGLELIPEDPSRLIERDRQLEAFNHFINQLPEHQSGLFTIFGEPGSGKSRFLSETRKIARLQGYALLSIKGTNAVKSRVFGGLDIARHEFENLPIPSESIPDFTSALFQSLIDKGNAGLFVTVDNVNQLDRYTLDYIGSLFQHDIHPVCVLYSSESSSEVIDPVREKLLRDADLIETTVLEPITPTGLRIWLRHSLHWESPNDFVEWLHHETGGSPSNIQHGLHYLLENSIIKRTAAGYEYQNLAHLPLTQLLTAEDNTPIINFPLGVTPFIGREEEIHSIKSLLTEHRLVTITGSGGSGKSRLAAQIAAELQEFYRDGIVFVPLSSLSKPNYLITTLASFLSIPLSAAQDPLKTLINNLKQKHLLLVLDNFENLLQGSDLIADILKQTSGIRVLITSRERLDLADEMVVELSGLRYPDSVTSDQIERHSAVQLFVHCARHIKSDFTITNENRCHIARICHIVAGMPLAVELAAAGVQSFEPKQIADKIEESLSFLTSDQEDIPNTQRSVMAILASFWDSLSEIEQEIVCRLAVFKTRFSEDAARKIAGASPFFLEALVSRSFLRKTPRSRFELHGLLRQFAYNQLAKNPNELEKTLENHCKYYTNYLSERQTSILQSKQGLDEIDQEIDNIRAAWGWAMQRQRVEIFEQSAYVLHMYYMLMGYLNEGLNNLSDVAACINNVRQNAPSDNLDRLYVKILSNISNYHNWLNQYDAAEKIIQEAHPIAEKLQDHNLLAEIMLEWGMRLYMTSDFSEAKRIMEVALEHARLSGARKLEADILRNIGNIALDIESNTAEGAGRYYQQSLDIAREIGDIRGEGGSLNNLGIIALFNDRYSQALEYFAQNLQVARKLGDRIMESIALSNMGVVKTYTYEFLEGKQYLAEALKIISSIGDRQGQGVALWSLGYLQMSAGDYSEARQSLEKSHAILHEVGDRGTDSRVLSELACLCLQEGRYKAGKQYCVQASELGAEVGLKDIEVYNSVTYGRILTYEEDLDQAETAFKTALNAQKEVGKEFMQVEPLAGLARLALKTNNIHLAMEHVENILNKISAAKSAGDLEDYLASLLDNVEVYMACYDVLKSNNDPRALPILKEAYSALIEHAMRSQDESSRQMFLYRSPSHKYLISEFEKQSIAIPTII